MLVCKAHIWAFLCAYICAFVRKNASIRGKKTHVYRVAGMIASIRGKKTARISCHNFETNGRPYYKSTLATLFAAIWKIILGGILF